MGVTSLRFSKQDRLLTGRDFRGVKKGKSLVGKYLVLEIAPSVTDRSRLGLAASKRYGKACQRNRFKRLVREAFRRLLPNVKENIDIVVRPRKLALGAGYKEISTELAKMVSGVY